MSIVSDVSGASLLEPAAMRMSTRLGTPTIVIALAIALKRGVALLVDRDVAFDDEAGYLKAGVDLFRHHPQAVDGPLYSFWYWLLHVIVTDRVNLYLASWGLLLVTVIALVAVVMKAGRGSSVAAILAAAIVAGTRGIVVWPYVSLFAAALVLGSLSYALYAKEHHAIVARLSVGFAAAAFARPEYLYGYACLALVFAAATWNRRPRSSELVLLLTPVLLLVAVFGFPVGGGRTQVAFGQHFAVNVVQASGKHVDPWNEWRAITTRELGGALGPGEALLQKPRAFFWQVGRNAEGLPLALLRLAEPSWVSGRVAVAGGLFAWVLIAAGLLFYAREPNESRHAIGLCIVAVALVSVASALVIYPREHYLLPLWILLVVTAAIGLSRAFASVLQSNRLLIAAAAAALLFVPCSDGSWLVPHSVARPNIEVIRALHRLPPIASNLIEPDYGRAFFADRPYTRVDQSGCGSLTDCVEKNDAAIVVLNPRLTSFFEERHDPSLGAFLDQPSAFGFRFVAVPNTDTLLALKAATFPATQH